MSSVGVRLVLVKKTLQLDQMLFCHRLEFIIVILQILVSFEDLFWKGKDRLNKVLRSSPRLFQLTHSYRYNESCDRMIDTTLIFPFS
jgi:hypothetical protein